MTKRILLLALTLISLARPACDLVTLPLDWTAATGISRANLNLNPIALRDGHNDCADSLNTVLAAFTGWAGALTLASNQDLVLKVDADANGAHKLAVTANSLDTMFRVHESGLARFFNALTVDSAISAHKMTLTDSLILTAATASRLLSTGAGKQAASVSDLTSWIAGTVNQITSTSDGDGTLTLSLPSAVTFPGSGQFTTTLGVTGLQSNSEAIAFTANGTGGAGRIYRSATNGLAIRGVTGSTNDFALVDAANNTIARNPTGTTDMVFHGLLTATGGVAIAGGTEAAGSIVKSATSGLDIRGVTGTNYDLVLIAADGNPVMRVPTGTTTAQFFGAVTHNSTLLQTGVATFTAAPVFNSVTASQFLLVDGSKALTSVAGTGSGSVVRATSPTLTTPVLGAATGTSLNLSGNLTADSIVSAKVHEEGSFTGTLTGVTGTVTGTIRYVRIFKQVTIMIPQIIGTSNSAEATITGMPAGIRPARPVAFIANLMDNAAYSDATTSVIRIETGGTITLIWNAADDGFTSSGFKGFVGQAYVGGSTDNVQAFTYTLQ